MLENYPKWIEDLKEIYKGVEIEFIPELSMSSGGRRITIFIFHVQNTHNGFCLNKAMSDEEFYSCKFEPERNFKAIFAALIKQVGGRIK